MELLLKLLRIGDHKLVILFDHEQLLQTHPSTLILLYISSKSATLNLFRYSEMRGRRVVIFWEMGVWLISWVLQLFIMEIMHLMGFRNEGFKMDWGRLMMPSQS